MRAEPQDSTQMLRIRKFGEIPCGYDARAFDISLH